MPCPTPNRCHRAVRCLLALFGLALLSSCAHPVAKIRVSSVQNLRLTTSETYAVSVLCACKTTDSCDTGVMQHLLTSCLRTRGVRLVHASKASRTITLHCRELPRPPRNELPLAPGSRLWYQRRIFSPVSVRASSNPQALGPLRMEVTIRATQATGGDVQPSQLQATMIVADRSEDGLKTAVDFLIDAIR
jgi:hypothetical protein